MTDHQVRVHHFDIAHDADVAGLHHGRAGGGKLKPLGTFAFHLQRDLLDVEDDVGHVFAHAGQRREFMQDVLDLDRGDRRALKRGQKNPTQRVAERQAETALQRLGNERRLALAVARRLDLEAVGLLQFLPVLHVDSHVFPLGMGRNAV